jgi:hypothetical protein
MNRKARFALPVALLLFHQLAFADALLNKCTDGKEITYTDKTCEKLGLTNAGPINRDNVTIVPATRIPAMPQSGNTHEDKQNAAPVAADTDVYQCTNYFGLISFSDSPCKEVSFVPQLKTYVPATQMSVSHKVACEAIGSDSDVKSRSSLSCP